MTTPESTRPTGDNTGGAPTEAELIDHLQDIDRPVSLDQLAKATGAARDTLKGRLERLEARGLIIISIGLYYVTVSLVDGSQLVVDGGRAHPVADIDLSPEQIYTILSNERRRETLRFLSRLADRDAETYAPVGPLSAVVCASGEEFCPKTGGDDDDQHATYVALTQTHLPLLHDLGAVEYYSRVQKVAPTDIGLALTELMDIVDGAADTGESA